LVEQWHASGVSAREFAESHGVSPSQLYAWGRASAPPKLGAAIAFTVGFDDRREAVVAL